MTAFIAIYAALAGQRYIIARALGAENVLRCALLWRLPR
jgi:hypothetical protein